MVLLRLRVIIPLVRTIGGARRRVTPGLVCRAPFLRGLGLDVVAGFVGCVVVCWGDV